MSVRQLSVSEAISREVLLERGVGLSRDVSRRLFEARLPAVRGGHQEHASSPLRDTQLRRVDTKRKFLYKPVLHAALPRWPETSEGRSAEASPGEVTPSAPFSWFGSPAALWAWPSVDGCTLFRENICVASGRWLLCGRAVSANTAHHARIFSAWRRYCRQRVPGFFFAAFTRTAPRLGKNACATLREAWSVGAPSSSML